MNGIKLGFGLSFIAAVSAAGEHAQVHKFHPKVLYSSRHQLLQQQVME